MRNYHLDEKMNERIVDGIIEGYRDYLDVRREKALDLKVHGAYAWVKGNHIDHYVALACEEYGVKSTVAKAGLTWQYLQFAYEDEKALFIVRNARYFNKEEVDKGKDARGRRRAGQASYMNHLMAVNTEVDFDAMLLHKSDQSIQLELFDSFEVQTTDPKEVKNIETQFDRFYIATYHITEDHQISEICLWMPNPANNKAYLISDLTPLIGKKPGHRIEIEDELKAVLTQTYAAEGVLDATAFGIAVNGEQEEKES